MRLPFHRVALFSLLAVLASALSCGREPTAPHGAKDLRRLARLSLAPQFPPLFAAGVASSAVPFERVHIVLHRADGTVALDTTIVFPAGADSVSLTLNVLLSPSAPATGEPLSLNLGYVNAAGDTVFKGGPIDVTAAPAGAGAPAAPVTIPVSYSGTGSNAARVIIAPKSAGGFPGDQINFSATAQDGGGLTLPGTPVVFTSLDASRVTFASPTAGAALLAGDRGTARVVAQLLTGPADTATVTVTLPARSLEAISGGGQNAQVGTQLADPVVVRAFALDGVGVAGVTVTFAVASGGGSVGSATVVTDSAGRAQTTWRLGSAIGPQTVTATAAGLSGSPVTFSATARSGAPVRLVFLAPPGTSVAGALIGPVTVRALDAQGALATTFTGAVTVGLDPSSPSPALFGTLTAAAVNGVAAFADLRINAAGNGFVMVANAIGLVSASSPPFAVTVGPARRLEFGTYPISVTAGTTIDPITAFARDSAGNLNTSFTGAVTLGLAAGPAGAAVLGRATANAVAGVATFDSVRLNVAGTYRFNAAATGLASPTGPQFDVLPSPTRSLLVMRGGGQSAPAGATLPDTIVVKLTDLVGNPIVGAAVTFAVASGGGTLAVLNGTTDGSGFARARWTLGAGAGGQSLMVTATGVSPLSVFATAIGATGPVRVFFGVASVNLGTGSSNAVTVFLTQASASPVDVALSVLDTLSAWSSASVTIPAGATSALVNLLGRAAGTSLAVANGGTAGSDTLSAYVYASTVSFLDYYYSMHRSGDTLETRVVLSAPAPVGGVTVTFDVSDTTRIRIVQSPGTREAGGCGECGCGALLKPKRDSLLAPGIKPNYSVLPGATLVIKQGEMTGYVYFISTDSTGYVDVGPTAPGYAGQTSYITINDRHLSVSTYPAFFANGTRSIGSVYHGAYSQVALPVTLTARTPGIVSVPSSVVIPKTQSSENFSFTTLAPGGTWIVVSAPGWSSDSTFVTVTTPRLKICCDPFLTVGSARFAATALVTDSTGAYSGYYYSSNMRLAPLVVSLSTLDTNIARPASSSVTIDADRSYGDFQVTPIGVGTTRLIASAPGFIPDSFAYTVTGLNQLRCSCWVSSWNVGVGLVKSGLTLYTDRPVPEPTRVTLTIAGADSTKIDVQPRSVVIPAGWSTSEPFQFVGKSVGSPTITASGPGLSTIGIYPYVTNAGFRRSFASSGPYYPGQATWFYGYVVNSWSESQPLAAPLTVTLSSSNPAVLRVDTLRTMAAGGTSFTAYMYPVAPGTARIYTTAPGFSTDSGWVITVSPLTRQVAFCCTDPLVVGRNQVAALSLSRADTGSYPATTATVTKLGTHTSLSATSFPFSVGSTYADAVLQVTGLTAGVDTLIVTAPGGFVADTNIVRVTAPALGLYDISSYVIANYPYSNLGIVLRDSLGNTHYPSDTVRLRIASSDTNVARPDVSTVLIPPTEYVAWPHITFRGPGTVSFTVTDLGGVYPTVTSATTTVQMPYLYFSQSEFNLGTQQETYFGESSEAYVYSDYPALVDTWVRLVRSTSALVTMPDSVLIPAGSYYGYFQIAALDTVGALQLLATAPAFVQGSATVQVTRGSFAFWIYPSSTSTATSFAYVEVDAIETVGMNTHPVREDVAVSLSVDSASVATLDSSVLVIPTGSAWNGNARLRILGPGTVHLTASDARGIYRRYLPGTGTLTVTRGEILAYPSTVRVGVNQRYNDAYLYLNATFDTTVYIPFTRTAGAHTVVPAAGVDTLAAYNYYWYPRLDGVSLGADTITYTLPGFRSGTLVVEVQPGILATGAVPASLRAGDSAYVALILRRPDNSDAIATANTTLGLSATGGGSWTASGAPITSALVPSGYTSVYVWIKTSTAGTATFTVSSSNYVSRTLSVLVTP